MYSVKHAGITSLVIKWSNWYCCSSLDLRVKAEGSSNEVLQLACSFGVGEGTSIPNWTEAWQHTVWYNS